MTPDRPDPGLPGWARPGAPALGPVIELAPANAEGTPAGPDAGQTPPTQTKVVRNLTMTMIDRVRGIVSKTTLGGYGEFVFHKYPGEDSAFEARRFVVFLYAPIFERITLAAELEWEGGGTPVLKNGQATLGESITEFSVIDVKLWNFLTLRGGVLLMPVGRLNVNHDSPSLELTDRPLVDTLIIPSTWSETGVGMTGRIPIGPVALSYEIYVVNGLTSNINTTDGLRDARGSLVSDNNGDKGVTGRVAGYYSPFRGAWLPRVEIGVSGYTGEYDRSGDRVGLLALDWDVRNSYFEFIGEWARAFIDPGFNDDYLGSSRTAVPTGMAGFYAELRGRLPLRLFAPRAHGLPSWLGETVFTGVVRYEEVNTNLPQGDDSPTNQQRLVFGLNLRLSAAFVFKNELQLNNTGGDRSQLFLSPRLGYVSSVAFLY